MSCTNCPSKGFSDIDTPELIHNVYRKISPNDWLTEFPDSQPTSKLVEISFKNNRKEIYLNQKEINLKRGEYVTVQCENGHGVGIVTLTGKLAELQYNRKESTQLPEKIIYRHANRMDIEKLTKARLREKPIMIRARHLANSLNLVMKISDVEFQGDGSKATFYYIADERVDFRELIKLFAQEFQVRIEMRQIGARQESALLGGIGTCGRELCCSSWRTKFDTVSTNAARVQELPPNAQKLTGQCGKLKCCLMYELDQYIEAHTDFPDVLLELETEQGIAIPQKKDLLKKIIFYSIESDVNSELIPIPLEKVKEIIQLNKKGIKPPIGKEKNNFQSGFTNSEKQVSLEELVTKHTNRQKKHYSNKKRIKAKEN